MLVSASHQPIVASKRMVTDTRVRNIADYEINNPGLHISFSHPVAEGDPSVKIQNKLFSYKIFPITFSYLGHIYHTKVLKVTYRSIESMYKVVLNNSISNNTPICWLQHEPQGWTISLGQELEERLLGAITTAIGCHEELGLI